MNTAHRLAAACAAACRALIAPSTAVGQTEPAPPPEQPGELQWPPASTHGKLVPLPEEFYAPVTLPLCDSEVTITQEDVEPATYRALVTEDGDTVVEYGGSIALDITRASDGATLEDILLDSAPVETYYADGLSATFDYPGPAMVFAQEEVDIQALVEEGLPPAFLYLSGRLVSTATLESVPEPGGEPPVIAEVEIVENTTEYVFDVCDLLDRAATGEQPDLTQPTG
jgi:hypothetical protein